MQPSTPKSPNPVIVDQPFIELGPYARHLAAPASPVTATVRLPPSGVSLRHGSLTKIARRILSWPKGPYSGLAPWRGAARTVQEHVNPVECALSAVVLVSLCWRRIERREDTTLTAWMAVTIMAECLEASRTSLGSAWRWFGLMAAAVTRRVG